MVESGLKMPIHRGPTLNDILLKLNNGNYLSLIDVSSGYYNLKLDKKSSYFMRFACHFGRYKYKRLPFGAAMASDMFQRKFDEIFKDMPNVFGIADEILVAGYEAFERIMIKQYGGCCRDADKLTSN